MNYKLDNIDISEYGAIPIIQSEYLALEGLFSLPKRVGETEYNWGTSIEPYLDEKDIELDGRMLTLNVCIRGNGIELKNKIEAFASACVACRELSFDLDSFSVICKDEIQVKEHGDIAMITAKFWQKDFQLKPLTKEPSATGNYQLDEYDLRSDFGIIISERNSLESLAKRIEAQTTKPYQLTEYRELISITLDCFMKGDSISDLYDKACQFQALCMRTGARKLEILKDGILCIADVYIKDGFSAKLLFDSVIQFQLNAVVISNNNIPIVQRITSDGLVRRTAIGGIRIIN